MKKILKRITRVAGGEPSSMSEIASRKTSQSDQSRQHINEPRLRHSDPKKDPLSRLARKVRRKLFPRIKKVDFMICGTQKGGTSALEGYLRHHPDVCVAYKKEVHFFDNEKIFARWKPDYSWYHDFFHPKKPYKLVGEATPEYMYWFDAPRRIWKYNPRAKLIVILRNPIERAYSQWNMQTDRKQENLSFWDAIHENQRCRQSRPAQHHFFSYIERGYYMEQLRRIHLYFDPSQVLVLKTEDLKDRAAETLGKVCNFLGIDNFEKIEEKTVHERTYEAPMGDREWDFLSSLYQNEIHEIERAFGWDCSDWLSRRSTHLKRGLLIGLSFLSILLPDLIDAVEIYI